MKTSFCLTAALLLISACAQTDIQPLTRTSFEVATTAAPACGASGARMVANKAAAIEVIKRGGDQFVYVASKQDSHMTGMNYNQFAGFQTYNAHDQNMVVQMIAPGAPGSSEALSARQILGPDWQQQVADGVPNNCTSQG